jgi:hypothetical protein
MSQLSQQARLGQRKINRRGSRKNGGNSAHGFRISGVWESVATKRTDIGTVFAIAAIIRHLVVPMVAMVKGYAG